jgi:electron transport complex protein RnfD
MVFLGAFVASAVGKMVFGGLGQNPFNPALVGRAFLQAAFPTAITRWTPPESGFEQLSTVTLSLPFASSKLVDGVSGATPLGLAKFEHQFSELGPLLWGNVSGSLGETSTALLLVLAVWLSLRRVFDYRLFVGTVGSVLVLSAFLHAVWPAACPPPLFMVCSGGLMFGATFMVTDPVTSPVTALGAWIFGAGVGALVVLIRAFGGLPEGVMYAVLSMNAVCPLIERFTQPKPFGANVRT